MQLTINECTRKNLCVDCDNEKCWFYGKLIADCPKCRCDRPEQLLEDCETCAFLKRFQRGASMMDFASECIRSLIKALEEERKQTHSTINIMHTFMLMTKSNNWLKMHSYPKRRKGRRKRKYEN